MTRISSYFDLYIPFPMFRDLCAVGAVALVCFVAWEYVYQAEYLHELKGLV